MELTDVYVTIPFPHLNQIVAQICVVEEIIKALFNQGKKIAIVPFIGVVMWTVRNVIVLTEYRYAIDKKSQITTF